GGIRAENYRGILAARRVANRIIADLPIHLSEWPEDAPRSFEIAMPFPPPAPVKRCWQYFRFGSSAPIRDSARSRSASEIRASMPPVPDCCAVDRGRPPPR